MIIAKQIKIVQRMFDAGIFLTLQLENGSLADILLEDVPNGLPEAEHKAMLYHQTLGGTLPIVRE